MSALGVTPDKPGWWHARLMGSTPRSPQCCGLGRRERLSGCSHARWNRVRVRCARSADLHGDRAAYLIAYLGTLQRPQLRSCCRWPVLRGRLPAPGIGSAFLPFRDVPVRWPTVTRTGGGSVKTASLAKPRTPRWTAPAILETLACRYDYIYQVSLVCVVDFLEFLGRNIIAGRVQPFPVVPGDPFQGREHDIRRPGPRPVPIDKLFLV
jgi:hypothetical protein